MPLPRWRFIPRYPAKDSGNLVSNFGGELLTPLYLFDQISVRGPMLSPHVPARNILEVDSDR